MTRLPIALAATLLLAACGQRTPSTPPAAAQPQAAPSTIAGTAVTDPRAVPPAFQGVWAVTENDCAKPAETRLTITPTTLTFYESHGAVGAVEATGPDEIIIHIPLTGEGETSDRTFRYRLINDGAALFDIRNGLTRIRCAVH